MSHPVLHQHYSMQSLLSRKTGRRTYLARDLRNHTTVIVKVLLFGPDFTWEDLKLFEREASILKALSHPAIPQYLDSFEVDMESGKGFAFVQTHIQARSLQEWMQTGHKFSEAELKAIASQLLAILDYLHTRQPPVIHRDLKPSNVLLSEPSDRPTATPRSDDPGQVYLVDFGSVQTAAQGGTVTVVGTYGYMPPEQFGGRTTPASDLYSLGATLVYLLTGTHPADLPTRQGVIQFAADSLASEQFQTWLRYLIQPEISQRFPSAQGALEALHNDQWLSPDHPCPTQPRGSRILLTKTETELKLVIPPLRPRQKLIVICSMIWFTALACTPLLLGLWKLQAALWVSPLVLWGVLLIWVKNGYKLFAKMQLLIDESKIYFTWGWLGFKKKKSAPTQDITKLERLLLKIDHQEPSHPQVQYSGLQLWVGNECHSWNGFNLTQVELDWLAVELSEWLDLPLQISGSVISASPKHSDQTQIQKLNARSQASQNDLFTSPEPPNEFAKIIGMPVQSSSEGNCFSSVHSHSTQLKEIKARSPAPVNSTAICPDPPHKINRPANAQCFVDQDGEAIQISAPAGNGIILQVFICIVGVFLFIAGMMHGISITPVAALIAGIVSVILWNMGDRLGRQMRTTRIILQIDQQDISLWEKPRSGQLRCLKKTARSAIYKLQLVYTKSSSSQSCHVKVCTAATSSRQTEEFLIGNRSFWLPRREAEWLAHELSNWLKLPVTEVEVVNHGA